MKEIAITVKNPTGLHTRPGTEFVQLAKTFESDITVKKGEKEANAKSIVKLLKIGISCGDEITVAAAGSDEDKAIAALTAYIENLSE
ncbi:MAG: HPr family phosphocarrier protein [Treponema sp.]